MRESPPARKNSAKPLPVERDGEVVGVLQDRRREQALLVMNCCGPSVKRTGRRPRRLCRFAGSEPPVHRAKSVIGASTGLIGAPPPRRAGASRYREPPWRRTSSMSRCRRVERSRHRPPPRSGADDSSGIAFVAAADVGQHAEAWHRPCSSRVKSSSRVRSLWRVPPRSLTTKILAVGPGADHRADVATVEHRARPARVRERRAAVAISAARTAGTRGDERWPPSPMSLPRRRASSKALQVEARPPRATAAASSVRSWPASRTAARGGSVEQAGVEMRQAELAAARRLASVPLPDAAGPSIAR